MKNALVWRVAEGGCNFAQRSPGLNKAAVFATKFLARASYSA
jgi:hypothetical protein